MTHCLCKACASRGLLQDNAEWKNVFVDAAGFQMPKVIILNYCEPCYPLSLWTAHKGILCEDYGRRSQAQTEQATLADIILLLDNGVSLLQIIICLPWINYLQMR